MNGLGFEEIKRRAVGGAVESELYGGARRMEYIDPGTPWKTYFIAYSDCSDCGGSGRVRVEPLKIIESSYYRQCERCSKRFEKPVLRKRKTPKPTITIKLHPVDPMRALLGGVDKYRFRCPECLRAAKDNFCKLHGEVSVIDLLKLKDFWKLLAILEIDIRGVVYDAIERGETVLSVSEIAGAVGTTPAIVEYWLQTPDMQSDDPKSFREDDILRWQGVQIKR